MAVSVARQHWTREKFFAAGGFSQPITFIRCSGSPGRRKIIVGFEATRKAQPRPRYGATPWSGSQTSAGQMPVCQNTSIGMPPRGYQ